MKVTVFGSQGMAGHVMVRYLRSRGHQVLALSRDQVDIEFTSMVNSCLQSLPPMDFVINCVGLLVKASNDRPDRASVINSWWPHKLAHHYRNSHTRVIHLSTDCVFDGSDGPYSEQAVHSERNAYGRSKSLGEINNAKDLTMRMSIIGPELKSGTGLMDWVRGANSTELPGWDNAWWNGITTLELARCVDAYMQNPTISGIYHVVKNNQAINKYDLLCLINQVFGLEKSILRTQGPKSINKVLVDTRREFDFAIADYRTQLEQLRDFCPIAHVSPASA